MTSLDKKFLIVGDCHIRPQDLDEGVKFVKFLDQKAQECQVDAIVFMGDQCHTHNVVYNNVLKFWKESILLLSKHVKDVILVVGNHDLERGLSAHSMEWFKDYTLVVDKPLVYNNKLFLPYIGDNQKFIDICNNFCEISIVFCHEEFSSDGLTYDNGMYIPNGINPQHLPQSLIVSGHIHMAQRAGKVFYVGSPRWLSLGDANIEKFVYVTDFSNELVRIPTDKVCKPIYKFTDVQDKDGSDAPLVGFKNGDVTVDIYGDAQYIAKRTKTYMDNGYKVRSFPLNNKNIEVKESEGILHAFNNFIVSYKPTNMTTNERLQTISNERIKWMI